MGGRPYPRIFDPRGCPIYLLSFFLFSRNLISRHPCLPFVLFPPSYPTTDVQFTRELAVVGVPPRKPFSPCTAWVFPRGLWRMACFCTDLSLPLPRRLHNRSICRCVAPRLFRARLNDLVVSVQVPPFLESPSFCS